MSGGIQQRKLWHSQGHVRTDGVTNQNICSLYKYSKKGHKHNGGNSRDNKCFIGKASMGAPEYPTIQSPERHKDSSYHKVRSFENAVRVGKPAPSLQKGASGVFIFFSQQPGGSRAQRGCDATPH